MTTPQPTPAYELADYIKIHFNGSIPRFAEVQGTTRHHVHKWIERGAVVMNGKVYTFRRELVGFVDEGAE